MRGKFQPFKFLILISFLVNSFNFYGSAVASSVSLPKAGTLVRLSPDFSPTLLKGIRINPSNPFRFDFIVDVPDQTIAEDQLKEESNKLLKYFLASLTVPEEDLWVNLSPYEEDRIVAESFGKTEMGRDLLAQDYLLKQITASLIYPEDEVGKKFWSRVYEEAKQKYGTAKVPVNTFNKVWIVPNQAKVYENLKQGTAYVVESSLKVMLEEDYLATSVIARSKATKQSLKEQSSSNSAKEIIRATEGSLQAKEILQEIIIPILEKEVNQGKNFAQLRQVYNSYILAAWYKKKIKDSILRQIYVDQNKISGVDIENTNEYKEIYAQYLEAFKKGAYNYIKDEVDTITQQRIPRKYFSGGVVLKDFAMNVSKVPPQSDLKQLSARVLKAGLRFVSKNGVEADIYETKEVEVPKTFTSLKKMTILKDEIKDAFHQRVAGALPKAIFIKLAGGKKEGDAILTSLIKDGIVEEKINPLGRVVYELTEKDLSNVKRPQALSDPKHDKLWAELTKTPAEMMRADQVRVEILPQKDGNIGIEISASKDGKEMGRVHLHDDGKKNLWVSRLFLRDTSFPEEDEVGITDPETSMFYAPEEVEAAHRGLENALKQKFGNKLPLLYLTPLRQSKYNRLLVKAIGRQAYKEILSSRTKSTDLENLFHPMLRILAKASIGLTRKQRDFLMDLEISRMKENGESTINFERFIESFGQKKFELGLDKKKVEELIAAELSTMKSSGEKEINAQRLYSSIKEAMAPKFADRLLLEQVKMIIHEEMAAVRKDDKGINKTRLVSAFLSKTNPLTKKTVLPAQRQPSSSNLFMVLLLINDVIESASPKLGFQKLKAQVSIPDSIQNYFLYSGVLKWKIAMKPVHKHSARAISLFSAEMMYFKINKRKTSQVQLVWDAFNFFKIKLGFQQHLIEVEKVLTPHRRPIEQPMEDQSEDGGDILNNPINTQRLDDAFKEIRRLRALTQSDRGLFEQAFSHSPESAITNSFRKFLANENNSRLANADPLLKRNEFVNHQLIGEDKGNAIITALVALKVLKVVSSEEGIFKVQPGVKIDVTKLNNLMALQLKYKGKPEDIFVDVELIDSILDKHRPLSVADYLKSINSTFYEDLQALDLMPTIIEAYQNNYDVGRMGLLIEQKLKQDLYTSTGAIKEEVVKITPYGNLDQDLLVSIKGKNGRSANFDLMVVDKDEVMDVLPFYIANKIFNLINLSPKTEAEYWSEGKRYLPREIAQTGNGNAAMASKNTGGIDLKSERLDLQIDGGQGQINFKIDQVMLERLKNANGLIPVVMSIEPLGNIHSFLGAN